MSDAGEYGIGKLVAEIGIDTKEINKGMDSVITILAKSEAKMQKTESEMKTSLKGIQNAFKVLETGAELNMDAIFESTAKLSKGLSALNIAVRNVSAKTVKETKVMESGFNSLRTGIGHVVRELRNLNNQNSSTSKSLNELNARVQNTNTLLIAMRRELKGVAESQVAAASGARSLGSSFRAASAGSSNLFSSLARISLTSYIVVQDLRLIGEALSSLYAPGVKFFSTMENAQIGMSGIMTSALQHTNGEQLKFTEAMESSRAVMEKLRMEALRTTTSMEELVTTYQGILGPGLGAGLNVEQLTEIATLGANAVKSVGLAGNQLVQELRSILSEGITARGSTVATALGITNTDIAQAKAQGKVYEFLIERLQGFRGSIKATESTFLAMSTNITDGFQQMSEKGLTPFFNQAKIMLGEVQQLFFTTRLAQGKETGKKPGTGEEVKGETVNGVFFEEGKEISELNKQSLELMKNLGTITAVIMKNAQDTVHSFLDNADAVNAVKNSLAGVALVLKSVYNNAGDILTIIGTWGFMQGGLLAKVGILATAFGKLPEVLNFISENINLCMALTLSWTTISAVLSVAMSANASKFAIMASLTKGIIGVFAVLVTSTVGLDGVMQALNFVMNEGRDLITGLIATAGTLAIVFNTNLMTAITAVTSTAISYVAGLYASAAANGYLATSCKVLADSLSFLKLGFLANAVSAIPAMITSLYNYLSALAITAVTTISTYGVMGTLKLAVEGIRLAALSASQTLMGLVTAVRAWNISAGLGALATGALTLSVRGLLIVTGVGMAFIALGVALDYAMKIISWGTEKVGNFINSLFGLKSATDSATESLEKNTEAMFKNMQMQQQIAMRDISWKSLGNYYPEDVVARMKRRGEDPEKLLKDAQEKERKKLMGGLETKYPSSGGGGKAKGGSGRSEEERERLNEIDALFREQIAILKKQQAELDYLYSYGAIATEEYYDKTKQLSKEMIEAERNALEQKIALATKNSEIVKYQGELNKLAEKAAEEESKINKKRLKDYQAYYKDLTKIHEDYLKLIKDNIVADSMLSFSDTYSPILLKMEQVRRGLSEKIDAGGFEGEELENAKKILALTNEREETLKKIMEVKYAEAKLDELKNSLEARELSYTREAYEIARQKDEGLITTREETQKLYDLEKNQLETLLPLYKQQASYLKYMYETTKDPQYLQDFEELRQKLIELQKPLSAFEEELVDTFSDGLTDALTDTLNGVSSLKEGLNDIKDSLRNMINKELAEDMSRGIKKFFNFPSKSKNDILGDPQIQQEYNIIMQGAKESSKQLFDSLKLNAIDPMTSTVNTKIIPTLNSFADVVMQTTQKINSNFDDYFGDKNKELTPTNSLGKNSDSLNFSLSNYSKMYSEMFGIGKDTSLGKEKGLFSSSKKDESKLFKLEIDDENFGGNFLKSSNYLTKFTQSTKNSNKEMEFSAQNLSYFTGALAVATGNEGLMKFANGLNMAIDIIKSITALTGGGGSGFASGGLVSGPGTGTSDSISTRVSNGEYVVKAEAVRYFGAELFHTLNAKKAPDISHLGLMPKVRFATGGLVGGSSPENTFPYKESRENDLARNSRAQEQQASPQVNINCNFQSLDPSTGAKMFEAQMPMFKNKIIEWMHGDSGVRNSVRGVK